MLYSLYLSLNDSDVLSPPRWVGLANYERAFFVDDLFWSSLGRTFYYALLVVPAGVAGSVRLHGVGDPLDRPDRALERHRRQPHDDLPGRPAGRAAGARRRVRGR